METVRTMWVLRLAVLACLPWGAPKLMAGKEVLRSPETDRAIQYRFTSQDEQLLDAIERGCFLYLWCEIGTPAKLVRDRKEVDVSSTAAIGFQLSAIPIGVERGWITRDEGQERARAILQALLSRDDNRQFGVFCHFLDRNTGGLPANAPEFVASTVDHALLAAGALPAAVYFGGEVAKLTDHLLAETNWRAFDLGEGVLSMGWRTRNAQRGNEKLGLLDAKWTTCSDEERLIYFLATGAPREEYAIAPDAYYRLGRTVKQFNDLPPHVVSWNGSLFTYFFSHCWINYRELAEDDPTQFGVEAPRVDWFENSRRAVLSHRARCITQADNYRTFGANRWGLSPCMGRNDRGEATYLVPAVQPNLANTDNWIHGTVAPYAAGSSIIFAPPECMAALRESCQMRDSEGRLVAWRDLDSGGYGLVDSFNLDQNFASEDKIGIDVGPMLLAIENARTGLIWELFSRHEVAKKAHKRLNLRKRNRDLE